MGVGSKASPPSFKGFDMAITKTAILNKALTLVGANPIVNIDDDTNNARILKRVYEIALRSILSECKWNFATKRALLSVSADTLDWYDSGEIYVYVKPIDMIKIFGANDSKAVYREEGDYIVSDTQGLGLRYTYYIDSPEKYPASFIDAFIDKLCSDIAYAIVNSATLGEKFKTLYESVSLNKATSDNSQTGKQQTLVDDAWEMAKYGTSWEA
jgi:hypothetical protein